MAPTPLNTNFIANRTPTVAPPPTVDFGALQKKFVDASKATAQYLVDLGKIEIGFGRFNKASAKTAESVKVVDRSINVLGLTFKGTGKQLIQVATALGVVSGAFYDLSIRSELVTAPLKGIADTLDVLSNKSRGVELAQAIGIDTSDIQKLELFRAGIFGNTEALKAFRTSSQTAGIALTLNLTKLNTIIKASKDELRSIGQEARRLSKDLGGAVSASDIVAGQYQIASAGFVKSADSRAVAEASGKLATVGFNDFFSTADLVTKSLRAYGLEAGKASEVAAKLQAIVEAGITTIPELAAGFGETAVVANAFGISIDQLGAAIATITTQGSSTPEALTGIEALFRTLANQSPQAAKALSELSLNGERVKFDITAVKAKGLGNALNDLFKATNGNIEVIREIIPESRALQAALALAAQGGALFARSLETIADYTPAKLGDVFGEVQEDPTIKLKAITTKAGEIVGSLSGTYEKFTDSAIESVARFVSTTEVIANNPVIKGITDTFLTVSDTVSKVIGVFGSLSGAAISVLGTLATINVFNNLFNGGLIRQGKLIGESVFKLGNFGLALKQIAGQDISKSVITGLSKQLDDLRIKGEGLRIAGDTAGLEENKKQIADIQSSLRGIKKEVNKPYQVAFNGLKQARAEVLGLQAELSKLDVNDPRRADLLNKQRDAIGRVGEQALLAEQEIRKSEKAGTIKSGSAERRREDTRKIVDSIAPLAESGNQVLFDTVRQRTSINAITKELEKEKALGSKGDPARVKNLVESLRQVNQGTLGVIDNTGKLTNQYERVSTLGYKAGALIARGWDFAINGFRVGVKEINNVDQALRLAGRSENINNWGTALGKIFTSIPAGAGLALKGLKAVGTGVLQLGAQLVGQFLNPLTIGLGAIALVSQGVSEFNKGQELQQQTAQKLVEIEQKRTEAIRNTTKAIEERNRVEQLVKGGLKEKESLKIVEEERKRADVVKQLGQTADPNRRARLERQLSTRDFRSSSTFAKEELGQIRENRLGIGTDYGAARAKEQAAMIGTSTLAVGTGILGAGLGAWAVGAKIGASIGITLAGPVGLAAGALIGAVIGGTAGLIISETARKIAGDAEIQRVEEEFLARRQNELERKFKVDEAINPQEKAARQKKVVDQLAIDRAGFLAETAQNGLDDSVIQKLINEKDSRLKNTGEFLRLIKNDIIETNTLLDSVEKSFEENRIPEGFFESTDTTKKVNDLLAGIRQASVDDLQLVEADFKGRLQSLQDKKALYESRAQEAKDAGNKDVANSAKEKADSVAAQIERVSQLQNKLKPRLELSNRAFQNALRNGQGIAGAITTKESTSVGTSLEALQKALKSKDQNDINAISNNIQTLTTSLENLGNVDPDATIETLEKLRSILSSKDIADLNIQQITALQSAVASITNKLAQERIQKFEAILKRFQGLAGASGIAGIAGQEQQAQAQLRLLEETIKAQRQVVADAQGAPAKEKAINDLIQLQLEKKNKTIEARIQKEQNAANILFEREKARFDLQKSALELTRSDLDLKKQIFEQFGLQTEGVETELAQNKLKQLQSDAARQRAEIAKERADLVRQQQEGVEKQKILDTPTPANIDSGRKKEFSNIYPPDRKVEGLSDEKRIAAAKFRIEAATLAQIGKIYEETGGLENPLSNKKRDREIQRRIEEVKKNAEKQLETETANIRSGVSTRQQAIINDYNARLDERQRNRLEENTRTNKESLNAQSLNGTEPILITVKLKTNTQELQKLQKEELARLDARAKAQEEAAKKLQAEAQFAFDLASAYNQVIKPLERQSKLLQDTLSSTVQIFNTVAGLNPLYVSQQAIQGSIQVSANLQILSAQRELDVEKQKLDIREKLLAKNGLLTAEVKKQLDDQRALVESQFKQQTTQIRFEVSQASLDAFAKKFQVTIEQKIKGLDITKNAFDTYAGSFEDSDEKKAQDARKLAGAYAINIAVQQAALAEQLLKVEQEKTIQLLKQNDLQLQFLDIQLQLQATQTKDKDLLDAITTARSAVSGLRANIGQELIDAPARFAQEQELQRRQSVLSVSTAALGYQKEFGKPDELKTAQEQFLRQNGLSLTQPLGDTSVSGSVLRLTQQSDQNRAAFEAMRGNQQQQPTAVFPSIRRESDGTITNMPPQINITVNASTNATPQEIGRTVKQELLLISRDFNK